MTSRRMSYGGSGSSGSRGHSSFGGKGASQKKERKKKQEFHRHKVKYVEEDHLDFPKLKERVTISLQKLGQQVFSAEPGGYSLQDWMRSFNFLLDDFEEKVGPTKLPKEYYAKRQELTTEILKPIDTSDIDTTVEEIRKEEDEIKLRILEQDSARRQKLDEERLSSESKIGTLKKDRETILLRLDKEKQDAKKRRESEAAGKTSTTPSFFRRLFSGSARSAGALDASEGKRIADQESKAAKLQEEIDALEEENNSKAALADSAHKNDIKEESARLEELRNRLGELESVRAERMQLSEKRLQVTASIAEAISKITLSSETVSS